MGIGSKIGKKDFMHTINESNSRLIYQRLISDELELQPRFKESKSDSTN